MLTFWFEFASTYSCLTALRIEALARDSGVEVAWKPFLLGPIFKAQGWDTSPFNIYPAKGRYMWRDMERQFETLGLPPLKKPDEFPQNGLLAARIAVQGLEADWGRAFVRAVYRAQFVDGADISDAAVLSHILTSLRQDPAALIERTRSDATVKEKLRANTDTAQALGLFGAPSFTTTDEELFWGNDRLEDAIKWQAAINRVAG